jgi:hypothetical protein
MNRSLVLIAVGLAGLAAAGCKPAAEAPDVQNACYHVAPQKDGTVKFFKIADNDKNMYYCAVQLDEIRYRFMALGSNRDSIEGAYNGRYLFLDGRGLSTAPSHDGGRFFANTRGDDGRLVIPGGIPQPGPQGAGIMITQDPTLQKNVPGSRSAAKK